MAQEATGVASRMWRELLAPAGETLGSGGFSAVTSPVTWGPLYLGHVSLCPWD